MVKMASWLLTTFYCIYYKKMKINNYQWASLYGIVSKMNKGFSFWTECKIKSLQVLEKSCR